MSKCSGRIELPALVQGILAAISAAPRVSRCTLAIADDEHETLTSWTSALPDAAAAGAHDSGHAEHEADLPRDEWAAIVAGPRGCLPAGAPETAVSPLKRRVCRNGYPNALLAPLFLDERFLGALYAEFAAPPGAHDVAFVEHAAHLVSPLVWNAHTAARFRRGDRRRDTLIELGDAINTSLKLQTVITSAQRAIRSLAGHCYSALNLLAEDGQSYAVYASTEIDAAEPQVERLAGTALEAVVRSGRTYESDDLERRTEYRDDGTFRRHGVRRYVAAPMFVRNRIIGGVLFGSSDPRRMLRVDVWFQENIALQVALAIDNARQLDEVQRLSDRLAQQNTYLREEIQSEYAATDIVGQSPAMRAVHEAIGRVAGTDATVLILGETGVGKELVARAIHGASPRCGQPMVKVNCAAIPEGMVESELFGHERGAFTSAVERRIGRFELARDATLFLDEVGELPLAIQAKLLRVLQDGEFERVGGTRTLKTNTRIIAATNRDLLRAVHERAFRSDLYYRLHVFPIEVPPLRERPEDIPLLANAFIHQFRRRTGKRVESLDPVSLEELRRRDWPGNVRELRHVIERAMILSDGPVLRIEPTARVPQPLVQPAVASTGTDTATLSEVERDHIREVLERTAGVIEGPRGAARLLGLKPSTLRFRIRRLGIERRRPG